MDLSEEEYQERKAADEKERADRVREQSEKDAAFAKRAMAEHSKRATIRMDVAKACVAQLSDNMQLDPEEIAKRALACADALISRITYELDEVKKSLT